MTFVFCIFHSMNIMEFWKIKKLGNGSKGVCFLKHANGRKRHYYLFDDLESTETLEFATVCKETLVKNNLYAVIINRGSLQNFKELEKDDKGHKYMTASISVSEIYNFMSDGTEHWLESVDIPTTSDYYDDNVNCSLSEDSGRGYE